MADAFDEKALMDQIDGDLEFLGETAAMLEILKSGALP